MYGNIGIWKLKYSNNFILVCDECNAAWRDPTIVSAETAFFPNFSSDLQPQDQDSAAGSYATIDDDEQIRNLGWKEFLADKAS